MGFYPDVTRGDKFRPSAALENDIRHMLNSIDGFIAPGTNIRRNHDVVTIVNKSDTAFQPGMIVNLKMDDDRQSGVISAVPVENVDEKWGIVTGHIAPKEYGSCIISGVVSVPNSIIADYVEPDLTDPEKKKFTKSPKGGARVLAVFSSFMLVNLGEGRPSVGEAEYKNYFKVIPGVVEDGVMKTVKIVDGGAINPYYAGYTDIGRVDIGDLQIPDGNTFYTVYLILEWDDKAEEYKQYFSLQPGPTDKSVYWVLAEIENGAIVQRWTGGIIYWGTMYFV